MEPAAEGGSTGDPGWRRGRRVRAAMEPAVRLREQGRPPLTGSLQNRPPPWSPPSTAGAPNRSGAVWPFGGPQWSPPAERRDHPRWRLRSRRKRVPPTYSSPFVERRGHSKGPTGLTINVWAPQWSPPLKGGTITTPVPRTLGGDMLQWSSPSNSGSIPAGRRDVRQPVAGSPPTTGGSTLPKQ